MSGEARLTYGDAGVSLEAADEVVRRIAAAVSSTHTKDVLGSLGGFAPGDNPDPKLVLDAVRKHFEIGRKQ